MAKPQYPSTRKERAQAYLLVMEEVRARFEVLDATLLAALHPNLIREICYLQYRHLCELVAIGCLVAQGDFAAHRAFREDYNPNTIFKFLERIVITDPPDAVVTFFPHSVTRTIKDGTHHIDLDGKPHAATRKQLIDLWARSGNFLHRLSTAKFFKDKEVISEWKTELTTITEKLKALLDNHAIWILSERCMLVVTLSQPDCLVLAQYMGFGDDDQIQLEEYRLTR